MTVPPISSILGTLVLCWVQISQYAQLGGNSNLDPGAQATGRVGISPDFPQDKPVETGGVHHSDALHHGSADLHAPEAPADETQPLDGPLEVEDLQHGAPGDEGVDVPVLHDDAADAELAEVGEGGAFEARRARELPEAKVEAGEGGHPEERVGEEHLPRGGAVDEDELLDALGGKEAEPALEVRLARVHEAGHEVGAAEGPRLRATRRR